MHAPAKFDPMSEVHRLPEVIATEHDPLAHALAYAALWNVGTFERGTYLRFSPADGFAVPVATILIAVRPSIEDVRAVLEDVTVNFEPFIYMRWVRGTGTLYVAAARYVRDYGSAATLALKTGHQLMYDFARVRHFSLAPSEHDLNEAWGV